MANPEGMVTVQEAAQRLGRSLEQVRRYLREGRLPGQRIGGQWFIPGDALPFRYEPRGAPRDQIEESTVAMETRKLTKGEIEKLFREIDEHREAIRRRLGGNIGIDVVDLLREVREEH